MRRRDIAVLAVLLLAGSAALYLLHYVLFRDPLQEAYWLVLDLAFIPVNVLLVTLIIDRLLSTRERQALLEKLNMVIGVFFSEAGNELLQRLAAFDCSIEEVRPHLKPEASWKAKDYQEHKSEAVRHAARIDLCAGDLQGLKDFLEGERRFLLTLLANPNLLEHESFTDVLWAVTHVAEELDARPSLDGLPRSDQAHIEGDLKRAYGLMIGTWLDHMAHLASAYPYLFSLAARTNPFVQGCCATVEDAG